MDIVLDLHRDGTLLLLESTDVYNFIGERTNAELELAYLIDEWCKYLNYHIIHNKDMKFGDTEYGRLEGWLNGYNFAKKIDVNRGGGIVSFRFGKYKVELHEPFEF